MPAPEQRPGARHGSEDAVERRDFIREIIDEDQRTGRCGGRVVTRFPPEPNGYLHIGHAKSICLNFGIAADYGGVCNLRLDDTNPTKEEREYIDAICADVAWLGFDWQDRLFYASDYFEQMYEWAEFLIKKGRAYVCDLSTDEIRAHRGTLTTPGRNSPYRERTAAESLDLFRRMRAGEFPDGARVLRAKIDMASPNLNLRDPVLYRILHVSHPRAGAQWCIYPMYDYAHPLEDAIERITHSICTLEFEDHRPLYDWCLDELELPEPQPQQIEFARLNLTYTVLSKRRLLELVQRQLVSGWDDPRMPTISGLRRRGCTPEAIRAFCDRIGVAKRDSLVQIEWLEEALRDDLNRCAQRVMVVLRPIKLVLDNYPEGLVEDVELPNNPEDPAAGLRQAPFSGTLYIEREDFCEDPPTKYFRLAPGREVRLRGAYLVTATRAVRDERTGEVVEVHATYDPATKGGAAPDGRSPRGTLHWVSANHAIDVEVRLYDRLFRVEDPTDVPENGDWLANLNPTSLETLTGCKAEPLVARAQPGDRFQFQRQGYFCVDRVDSRPGRLVFNRAVSLRDSWAKIERRQRSAGA